MPPVAAFGAYEMFMWGSALIGAYMVGHAAQNVANSMQQNQADPPSSSDNTNSPADDSDAAGKGAKDGLSGDPGDCGTGNCKPRQNDPIKNKDKLEKQMKARGWTQQQIEDAIENGQQFPATNNATGGPATRYVSPQTGQSVVIDNQTGGIIHVGGPGFKY